MCINKWIWLQLFLDKAQIFLLAKQLNFICWFDLCTILCNKLRFRVFKVHCLKAANATPGWDGYIHSAGYCVMYDECGVNTENQKKVNCLYNDRAKLLHDSDGLELINELCPYLYKGKFTFLILSSLFSIWRLLGDNATTTCCSTNQLQTMKDNFKLPYQYLSRCPSCYRNFVALFCEMTCSPDQSLFTRVLLNHTGGEKRSISCNWRDVTWQLTQRFLVFVHTTTLSNTSRLLAITSQTSSPTRCLTLAVMSTAPRQTALLWRLCVDRMVINAPLR